MLITMLLFGGVLTSLASEPGGVAAHPPACVVTEPIRAEPPRDPNADPFGTGPWYINADRTIWAGWDATRLKSGKGGNKVLWIRPQGTRLTVAGRRLDAAASPLEVSIPSGYPTGFQPSGLVFPSSGCWEITATSGPSKLVFVTKVSPGN